MLTALVGVAGIRLLFQMRGELSFPQSALAAAVVFALVLQGAIFTLLLMIFYDPRRRTFQASAQCLERKIGAPLGGANSLQRAIFDEK